MRIQRSYDLLNSLYMLPTASRILPYLEELTSDQLKEWFQYQLIRCSELEKTGRQFWEPLGVLVVACHRYKSINPKIQEVQADFEKIEQLVAKAVLKEDPKLQVLLEEKKFIVPEPVLHYKEGSWSKMVNSFKDFFV